jgi:hypothetical protein
MSKTVVFCVVYVVISVLEERAASIFSLTSTLKMEEIH